MTNTDKHTATSTTANPDWLPNHTLYKPNSRGSGAAFSFSLNPAKGSVFLEAAPQTGDKQFAWDKKIIMKWGLSDLGQALAVIGGRQPQAKLFHQNERGNSSFDLLRRDDAEKAPYLMSVSHQLTADKSVSRLAITVSHAEAAVLETIFRTAVNRIIGW